MDTPHSNAAMRWSGPNSRSSSQRPSRRETPGPSSRSSSAEPIVLDPLDKDPQVHIHTALLRYGVQPNSKGSAHTDSAQKIARRVVEDGSQPPTIGMLHTLNPSIDDLVAGVKIGCDWLANALSTLLEDEQLPVKTRCIEYSNQYDPSLLGGYPSDRTASKRKNINWFHNCMKAAAEVWPWANPPMQDPICDFSFSPPYCYGLVSGSNSGYNTDTES